MKSIEQAATFWSRPRARHEPNDQKLVKKFALWRLDVLCPPCLWRAVTDYLAKSCSEHAAVRLTTQCVHSVAQMLQNQGSRRVRARFGDRPHGCGSPRAPASVATPLPGTHLRIALAPVRMATRPGCQWARGPARTIVKLSTFNLSVGTRMGTRTGVNRHAAQEALKKH